MIKDAIIVGSGSYVIGDSFGRGVVLPSLLYLQKTGKIRNIILAVRSERSPKFYNELEDFKKLLNTKYTPEIIIYKSIEDLIKLDLKNSLAFIAIPDNVHFEISSFFIKNYVPIWIVKPLTGNFESSKKLCELSLINNTKIWVDYHKRFDPSNLKIKEAISSGNFGDLNVYSVQYSQPSILPLNDLKFWSKDLNVLQYIGCHYIDQMFFLYPDLQFDRISCHGIEGFLIKNDGPRYDTIHCIIDFKTNNDKLIKFDLNVSWSDPKYSPGKSHQRVDLQFENGRIIADQKHRGMEIWSDNRFEQVNPDFFQIYLNPFTEENSPYGYGFESINKFISIETNINNTKINDSKIFPWAINCLNTDFILSKAEESLKDNAAWITN
jgi:predicted dehydrogenase